MRNPQIRIWVWRLSVLFDRIEHMFERMGAGNSGSAVGGSAGVLDAPTIAGWAVTLAGVDRNATDAERISQIRELEVLKCAAEAAQAVLTADFDSSPSRPAPRPGTAIGPRRHPRSTRTSTGRWRSRADRRPLPPPR